MTRAGGYGRLTAPDWVMLGIPIDEGVQIWASDTLTRAELEVLVSSSEFGRLFTVEDIGYALHAQMHSIQVCWGATYAEAMMKLLQTWQPADSKNRRSIGEAPRALPS